MRQAFRHLLRLTLVLSVPLTPGLAQQFDPRQPLAAIISAFQYCGPPQAYSMLSPQLYQTVYMQTQGRGCYPHIAQAGPVTGMQVVHQQTFPIGPLYVVRVTHNNVAADWYIGFNQATGQIEYLNYQAAAVSAPPPPPPTTRRPQPVEGPSPAPNPGATGGGSSGCQLYPAMCAN